MTDYWRDEGTQADAVNWNRSEAPSQSSAAPPFGSPNRSSARGLVLVVATVGMAVLLSVWGRGVMSDAGPPQTAAAATKSRGLVFGLCNDGGLTNCVASGDSFYLAGKNVRIAGIEAPQLYGAACPREAALGRNAAVKLQTLLNSGSLEMTKVPQDLDRYGLLLRNVAVDGKDLGSAMVSAGLAREIGDITRNWC